MESPLIFDANKAAQRIMYALVCGQQYSVVQSAENDSKEEEEKQKLALEEYQDKKYQITAALKF